MKISEQPKLAVTSFVMLVVSGLGALAVRCCLYLFDSQIEITTQISLAYMAVLIFWPFIIVSLLLGLISMFTTNKQPGFKLSTLTIVLSFLLIILIILTEIFSENKFL